MLYPCEITCTISWQFTETSGEKIMKYILILLLLSLPSTLFAADKWDTTDKVLVSTMWTARMIDMKQTMYIYDSPKYEEIGPVMKHLGEDAVVPWFVGTAIIFHYVAHILPDKWRTPFLVGANIGSWLQVIHNRQAGITINF